MFMTLSKYKTTHSKEKEEEEEKKKKKLNETQAKRFQRARGGVYAMCQPDVSDVSTRCVHPMCRPDVSTRCVHPRRPTSLACGAHSVSSTDAPLSSRRIMDRLLVSEPSRFMMVASSPTECTTSM